MQTFLHHFSLSAPLFLLAFIGYGLARLGRWSPTVGDGLARFAYEVAMPAMLFQLMTGFAQLHGVVARLLVDFFRGCFLVLFTR